MLPGQRMGRSAQERLVARVRLADGASGGVRYPRWYVQRWHFLPEGYLSPRGAALYESVVRHLYNSGAEGRVRAAVTEAVRSAGHASILEIGCGTGVLLADVSRALPDAELAGVDLSPYMLERARARLGARAALTHANAVGLPFEDERFDAVVAVHVLGHVPVPVADEIRAEAGRVLKPGGRAYVVDHAWHPGGTTGSLRVVRAVRLLGGLQRLSVFERAEEGGAAG